MPEAIDVFENVKKNVQKIKKTLPFKNPSFISRYKNKEKPNISNLMYEKFEIKIREFQNNFNMSVPKALVGTHYANKSLCETINIYLDLARFPEKLLENLNFDYNKND